MKKTHIIAIILLAIAAAIIFTTGEEASEYVDFEKAYNLSKKWKRNKNSRCGNTQKRCSRKYFGHEIQSR